MSMAAGEYVSVQSQADTEHADLAKERRELAEDPESELFELTGIYVRRGLQPELARQVAEQLTAHDALGSHARDELGITDTLRARPVQAALASAAAFAVGSLLPLAAVLLAPAARIEAITVAATLLGLGGLRRPGGLGRRCSDGARRGAGGVLGRAGDGRGFDDRPPVPRAHFGHLDGSPGPRQAANRGFFQMNAAPCGAARCAPQWRSLHCGTSGNTAPGTPHRMRTRKKLKATSMDIAHRAGVSQATVSRVLRGSPLVNAETRKRVEARSANSTTRSTAMPPACARSARARWRCCCSRIRPRTSRTSTRSSCRCSARSPAPARARARTC